MKRVLLVVCGLLLCGTGGVFGEGSERKELWRRELGKERCLLLYIEENGEWQMEFADGPWPCLTEELKERIKEAGMRLWERENGLLKEFKKVEKRC